MAKLKDTNIPEDRVEELSLSVFVKSLAVLLKPDEGVVIHHEDEAYVVYNNSQQETISLVSDDDYKQIEHGTPIWMHYDGSQAPQPDFEEDIIGWEENVTKH